MRLVGGLWLSACLAALCPGAQIPRPAPDLPIPLPDGRTIRTADFKGKIVVVEFLLTTCPGCQKAARILEKLGGEYASSGMEVIGVAANPEASTDLPNFRVKSGATFSIGSRSLEAVMNYLQIPAATVLKVPQIVFIDRAGVIRAQHGGDDQFFFLDEERNVRRQLTALLSETGDRKPRPVRSR